MEYATIEETINEQALTYMADWIIEQTEQDPVRLAQRRRLRRRQVRAIATEATELTTEPPGE